MKKKNVIIATAAFIVAILLVITAVIMLKTDAFGMNRAQRNATVATVGGSEKITANELAVSFNNYYSNIDTYNMYAMYYGYGTYHDVSTEEGVNALKEEILDELVEERAYIVMAAEKGITLTSEEEAECTESGKSSYQEMLDEYTSQYENYGYSDPENYAVTGVAEYLADYGIGTKAEYIRRATLTAKSEKLQEKLVAQLKEESGITAEQAESLYPEWAAYYQENYSDGAMAYYDTAFAAGQVTYRYVYIPEGSLFVRVIKLTDGARAEELMAEIGTDAEVFEKYCASEENTDTLMPLIAADDAYAITEGDNFEAAVYTEAATMNVGDIRLVTVTEETEETEATEESTEAAEGEETAESEEAAEPAATYYIVRRVEGTAGIVPFEKYQDAVTTEIVEEEQTEYAEQAIKDWIAADGNIVIDEDVIATVKAL